MYRLQRQYQLNEGVFSRIKDKASELLNKLKNIVTKFFENVIVKFIDGIKKLAKEGVTKLLEGLGLEITGTVSFKTPKW